MIDHDDIRSRIVRRLAEKRLPPTGVWLRDAGIGQTTLRNFLDGSTRSMTVETVAKLAPHLDATEEWLLFGDRGPAISEDELRQMIELALDEIQPAMPLAQIRRTVASALREQLKRQLSHRTEPFDPAEPTLRGTGAQSPAPTKQAEREG